MWSGSDIPAIIQLAQASVAAAVEEFNCSISDEYKNEEDDPFSAVLREMKLKGEFPCRLCHAVFPNLRALKGSKIVCLIQLLDQWGSATREPGPVAEPHGAPFRGAKTSSRHSAALICVNETNEQTEERERERERVSERQRETKDALRFSIVFHLPPPSLPSVSLYQFTPTFSMASLSISND